jgi:DNA-binding beta-propeller fold protein YncE
MGLVVLIRPYGVVMRVVGVLVAAAGVAGALGLVFLTGGARSAGSPAVRPVALVAAETENSLVVVDLATGHVRRRITLAADPEYVDAEDKNGPVVVVSARAGAVTILDGRTLRPLRVLRGFGSPHIPAFSPDRKWLYVTDDARGQLDVIRLSTDRVVARLFVGLQAHHFAFTPDQRQVWVALSQSARTLVIVDTTDPARPRVVGRFDPGFFAHTLLFTPDGSRVWITSASSDQIGVFSASTHRLLFRVPAGAPPQHIVFDGAVAYVASGYGSQIEMVKLATGQVLKTASAPYGSFELDASGRYVASSSLLRGTLAIYTRQLQLLRTIQIAPAAEDVALTRP